MASIKEGEEAVKNGASFITHLFNAMLPVSAHEMRNVLSQNAF